MAETSIIGGLTPLLCGCVPVGKYGVKSSSSARSSSFPFSTSVCEEKAV